MRIYFVGSLDETCPDYAIIQKNLKSLIIKFAETNIGFVVRAVKPKPGIKIPIDSVILDVLSEYNSNHIGYPADVLLIVEPGVSFNSPDIPHQTHSASSSIRTEFYREILKNTNLVLGIGGENGLLRFLMVSEWTGKPFHVLPGAGGSADILWQDYFKEALHLTMLKEDMVLSLKRTPYLNHLNDNFASELAIVLINFEKCLRNNPRIRRNIITEDDITLTGCIHAVKSFSLGLWSIIITICVSIFSLGYFIASIIGDK